MHGGEGRPIQSLSHRSLSLSAYMCVIAVVPLSGLFNKQSSPHGETLTKQHHPSLSLSLSPSLSPSLPVPLSLSSNKSSIFLCVSPYFRSLSVQGLCLFSPPSIHLALSRPLPISSNKANILLRSSGRKPHTPQQEYTVSAASITLLFTLKSYS